MIRKIDNEEPPETLLVVQATISEAALPERVRRRSAAGASEVPRPPARAANGSGEVPLRTYQQHFTDRDPLSRAVPERMLARGFQPSLPRTQERGRGAGAGGAHSTAGRPAFVLVGS